MTTHLHVHLEPNERKRRLLGKLRPDYTSAAQFFTEHAQENPERLTVSLDDLGLFIREFHAEQRAQGVDSAELRISPRRFLSPSASVLDVLRAASSAAADTHDPRVRLILLVNRDSPAEFIAECEDAVADGLPGRFVGVDLAGDETRFADVERFEPLFRTARSAGLGTTVHAGEFGDADNIWRAIDQLGATRIGHGTSAAGCEKLAARLSADQILMEISVTSNVALGAVPSLDSHPLPWFIEHGIPVCLNTDIPVHLGTDLTMEQQAAAILFHNDSQVLEVMEASARRHAFTDPGG